MAHREGYTTVASVDVSLADLHLRTENFREAKTHCENALIIYGQYRAGHSSHEISTGLIEIGGLFESIGESNRALCYCKGLLKS